MNFQFFGYTVRTTTLLDEPLARQYTRTNHAFWLTQHGGRESFLVTKDGVLVAFFQIEHIHRRAEQVRLHFQAFPECPSRVVLRGLLKLVPLIEKALALSGVRAIFFTSHSTAMAAFMQKKLGYTPELLDGGRDGVIMAKQVEGKNAARLHC